MGLVSLRSIRATSFITTYVWILLPNRRPTWTRAEQAEVIFPFRPCHFCLFRPPSCTNCTPSNIVMTLRLNSNSNSLAIPSCMELFTIFIASGSYFQLLTAFTLFKLFIWVIPHPPIIRLGVLKSKDSISVGTTKQLVPIAVYRLFPLLQKIHKGIQALLQQGGHCCQ